MFESTFAIIRREPAFRGAIIAPILVALVFAFFNLTSTVEPGDAAAAMILGIVNEDEEFSAPFGKVIISERILTGMQTSLPFGSATLDSEDDARAALDQGTVSMVLMIPANFSTSAMAGEPVEVRFLRTDHLSLAEAQFGQSVPPMIQANFSLAVTMVRQALAQGRPPVLNAPPPVAVADEVLHAAQGARGLFAPFVLLFPTWLAAMVGTLMLFIASRGSLRRDNHFSQSMVRLAVPVVSMGLSTLAGVLVVGLAADVWGGFIAPWLFLWLAGTAAAWVLMGLFSVLGFFALIVAVPLVFYQAPAAGAMSPVAAAPEWFAWINDVLPLSETLAGLRSLLIGGPAGDLPIGALAVVLVGGALLVVVGTAAHAMVKPASISGARR
jgi:hypothetical protein